MAKRAKMVEVGWYKGVCPCTWSIRFFGYYILHLILSYLTLPYITFLFLQETKRAQLLTELHAQWLTWRGSFQRNALRLESAVYLHILVFIPLKPQIPISTMFNLYNDQQQYNWKRPYRLWRHNYLAPQMRPYSKQGSRQIISGSVIIVAYSIPVLRMVRRRVNRLIFTNLTHTNRIGIRTACNVIFNYVKLK